MLRRSRDPLDRSRHDPVWAAGHRNRELVYPLSASACRDAADSCRQVEQAIKQRGLRVRVRYIAELMHKHTTVVE